MSYEKKMSAITIEELRKMVASGEVPEEMLEEFERGGRFMEVISEIAVVNRISLEAYYTAGYNMVLCSIDFMASEDRERALASIECIIEDLKNKKAEIFTKRAFENGAGLN